MVADAPALKLSAAPVVVTVADGVNAAVGALSTVTVRVVVAVCP